MNGETNPDVGESKVSQLEKRIQRLEEAFKEFIDLYNDHYHEVEISKDTELAYPEIDIEELLRGE